MKPVTYLDNVPTIDLMLTKERLKDVLDNWYKLANGDTVRTSIGVYIPSAGLCSNALAKLDAPTKWNLFENWAGFSGSLNFPVDGELEYFDGVEDITLYDNPKRLDLAEYCLEKVTAELDYRVGYVKSNNPLEVLASDLPSKESDDYPSKPVVALWLATITIAIVMLALALSSV